MGMFDSVYAPCAWCGENLEFQTKAGDRCMEIFTPENAPYHIAFDVLNDVSYCKCGNWTILADPKFPPEYVPPKPNLVPAKLRKPDDDYVTIHSSDTNMRWWNGPLKNKDIIQ